jgi:hypothetical protein
MELIVTADVGPRVIHCGLRGGQNLFKTFENQLGRSGAMSAALFASLHVWG